MATKLNQQEIETLLTSASKYTTDGSRGAKIPIKTLTSVWNQKGRPDYDDKIVAMLIDEFEYTRDIIQKIRDDAKKSAENSSDNSGGDDGYSASGGGELSLQEIRAVFRAAEKLRSGKLDIVDVGGMKDKAKKFFGGESYVTSDELLEWAGIGGTSAAIGNKIGAKVGLNKKVEFDDMMTAWQHNGSPYDSNSIINILKKKFKFNDNEIRKIFDAAEKDGGDSADYEKLVAAINKAGLTDDIIAYIDDVIKQGYKESVNNSASVISEKALADRDIKDLFYAINNEPKGKGEGSSAQNINDHIKKWSDEINKTEDKNEKIALVKEIVNFLADRHNTPEWGNVSKGVQKIIQKSGVDGNFATKAISNITGGKTMERILFRICNALLTESNIRWSDLQVMPVKTSGGYKLKPAIYQRRVLLEKFFDDVIIHDRVQMVRLGRRKK